MQRDPYLVQPGARKNNRNWLIRGTFEGKNDNEKSTGTTDENLARAMHARLVYEERTKQDHRINKTFRYAADEYIAWKNPSDREKGFLDEICKYIGNVAIRDITQSDLVGIANNIYKGKKGSSKNRGVMHPASAVIHYASKPTHKWCELWQIELFEETPVKKRTMTIEDARKFVKATDGIEKSLILWLFKHSDRITSSIEVMGPHIHLKENYYDRLTGKKKKKWIKAPLDPEVKASLMEVYGSKMPQGTIFPWKNRWTVYKWIKPISKRLKVKFTPHMARHSILSWIGDAGGNSIQIKTRAGHASLKSSEPYLAENLKVTRDITAKFVLGKTRASCRGKSSRKVRKHA